MKRKGIFFTVGLAISAVVLGVSLAHVGSQLDTSRLQNVDLRYKVGDLEHSVAVLKEERDQLQARVANQGKEIEHLSKEFGRLYSRAQEAEQAAEQAEAKLMEVIGTTPATKSSKEFSQYDEPSKKDEATAVH